MMNNSDRVDLNCDLGELEGDDGVKLDLAILPSIHSANVACGAHAGNPDRMQLLADACRKLGVAFGAHPGYPDRANFGRRIVSMTKTQIRELLGEQLKLSLSVANDAGISLAHVKPHGALYNLAAVDSGVAMTIAETVQSLAPQAWLFGLSGSCLIEAGRLLHLRTRSEIFADRNYQADGTLVPRDHPKSVLHDADLVIHRAVSMVREQEVTCLEGTRLPLKAETICLHGDTSNAVTLAKQLRAELDRQGL